MIDFDQFLTKSQIAAALMAIAFVVVWRFFVKYPPEGKIDKKKLGR